MSEESKNNLGSLGDMQVITETENKQDTNPETEVSGENKSETTKTEELKNEEKTVESLEDAFERVSAKHPAEVLEFVTAHAKLEDPKVVESMAGTKLGEYIINKYKIEYLELITKFMKQEAPATPETKQQSYQDFLNMIVPKELHFTAEVLMSALVKMERNDNNKDIPLDKFHDYVFAKHHDEFYEIVGKKNQDEKKLDGTKPLENASIEELKAMIERKKEHQNILPGFIPSNSDPSDLAKFVIALRKSNPLYCLYSGSNAYSMEYTLLSYPGDLRRFCWMYDVDNNKTTKLDCVHALRIVSVYEDFVVDVSVAPHLIERFIKKIFG